MPQPAASEHPAKLDEILFETFATEFDRQHGSGRATVERILFPTDFSPSSLQALPQAEELARRFGAELIVLHVDFAPTIYDLPEAGEPASKRAVERAVDLLRAHDFRARGIVSHGFPIDEIVRVAASERADLIVMGTHGRTGLKHALMGSVAEGVVRHAGCAVMTVRARGGKP
jgi:glycine betaine transporter